MARWFTLVTRLVVAILKSRRRLLLENLALHHQILVLNRNSKRPRLDYSDRLLWIWLAQNWRKWKAHLFIVQPDTLTRWHREGFRLFWKWKSRWQKPGRKPVESELRQLIGEMSRANPL